MSSCEFSFCFDLVEDVLPRMVQKTMNMHVLPNFKSMATMFINFDLYMSKRGVDTFVLVINY
jgi:hypothetical protein